VSFAFFCGQFLLLLTSLEADAVTADESEPQPGAAIKVCIVLRQNRLSATLSPIYVVL
jgi:hypothetical protein